LTGIAIREGFIKGIDCKIIDFLPEMFSPEMDPRTGEIELKHLLTMSAGFLWSDNADMRRCLNTENPLKTFFDTPLETVPGQKFNYNTACSYLLSVIITKTTGMKALDFADQYLFEPLGITDRQWREYNGYNSGGSDLFLQPRDMAKFGYLLLNRGMWDGKQIVPAAWVDEMTTVKNDGGSPHYEKYGYQCWITSIKGYKAYFAGGYGGQFILVVPDVDIVVAISSNTDQHYEENRNIVGRFILPALKRK
jgi:CubicO group peptidase (beta-lactamase class C family)